MVPYINNINNTNTSNGINLDKQSSVSEKEDITISKATKEKKLRSKKKGIPPQIVEVKEYFKIKNNPEIEAQKFFNYFSSNGWLVGGKAPMKTWKAAANNWMINAEKYKPTLVSVITNNLSVAANKNYSEPL